MFYKEYGKTGIKISVISFGGLRFEKSDDISLSAGLVREAHAKGINYFDTAPAYHNSEQIYGVAFPEMTRASGRDSFFVSTKTSKETPSEARRDLETSLTRMGISYIDFLHVWCLMDIADYENRKRNGVLKEFEKFKDEGLIKHICFSTHMNGEDIEKAVNDYDFAGILLGYSAMNFSFREKGLQAAAGKKMGVICMNPLGGGIIPQNPDIFSFIKTRKDESVVNAALGFLLSDDRISSALVGFSNSRQLEEIVAFTKNFTRKTETEKNKIREKIKTSFNELCTGCGYCDSCPQKIPIPKMMDAFNHYIFAGEKADALINRFKWQWEVNPGDVVFAKCVECGKCENLCTQKLPIIARLKKIKSILDSTS